MMLEENLNQKKKVKKNPNQKQTKTSRLKYRIKSMETVITTLREQRCVNTCGPLGVGLFRGFQRCNEKN